MSWWMKCKSDRNSDNLLRQIEMHKYEAFIRCFSLSQNDWSELQVSIIVVLLPFPEWIIGYSNRKKIENFQEMMKSSKNRTLRFHTKSTSLEINFDGWKYLPLTTFQSHWKQPQFQSNKWPRKNVKKRIHHGNIFFYEIWFAEHCTKTPFNFSLLL